MYSAVVGLPEWHKDHSHHHTLRFIEPTAESTVCHWLPLMARGYGKPPVAKATKITVDLMPLPWQCQRE